MGISKWKDKKVSMSNELDSLESTIRKVRAWSESRGTLVIYSRRLNKRVAWVHDTGHPSTSYTSYSRSDVRAIGSSSDAPLEWIDEVKRIFGNSSSVVYVKKT